MTDSSSDHAILNLSPEEKRAYATLFAQADKDQLGVVTGENAVSFFERTRVSPNVLGEIWQLADTENRGLLTKPGFCIVLRLIGHYQAGREPSAELAFKPAPIPKFDGVPALSGVPGGVGGGGGGGSGSGAANTATSPIAQSGIPPNPLQPQSSGNPPIRVPPLDLQKVQQFSALFDRSGAQNGLLDGSTAKSIFERAGLPNEALGRIWNLSDREQKGALDQTEFIVAMHLLTSMKNRAMTALPSTLPPGLYEAAARRGAPASNSRQGTGTGAIPRQLTGNSIGGIPRTQSPLARPAGYGTPPPAGVSGLPWLITAAEKVKFDQFFATIDPQGRGIISGVQAVTFFSDSRLPEDTLAQIWDLADINSEGQLNKDEFAVAMYLIRQQRAPNAGPLPAFLPPALVPPSMRKQQAQAPVTQQPSTAPAFDNANNTSNLSKSAADDLFGLDAPSSPQTVPLQPNVTGASATRDPFGGNSPASPSSPQRFQPQAQQASSVFKPFMPTSAFGASLASQNTGGSIGSNSTGARGAPSAKPSAMDDLLGDDETSVQESSKITNEAAEFANMSTQIGNLRTQMEQTQAKKNAMQSDLDASSTQKRELQARLQQFRTQYEQEVRTVKELEQQLTASRESRKTMEQELAILEGSYQDLQTQHATVSQALQSDQQENAGLKQRIADLNTEVTRLKPEIEKLKLDARQQKGLVSINKKQIATTEGERNRLQQQKADLESELAERESASRSIEPEPVVSPPPPASAVTSPGGSLNATNPFFRRTTNESTAERSPNPFATATSTSATPTPSAFDALFGPSAAFAPSGQTGAGASTPPATSFIGRTVPTLAATGISDSSAGEPTPSTTPPPSDQIREPPEASELPPPPPENRQFSPSHLPIVNLGHKSNDSETRSTNVVPPASRAGDLESPRDTFLSSSKAAEPNAELPTDEIPGAFPVTSPGPSRAQEAKSSKDDFDSAFADFGEDEASKDEGRSVDPFAVASSNPNASHSRGFSTEFPPIRALEPEDDDDDDSDDEEEEVAPAAQPGYEDELGAAGAGKPKAVDQVPIGRPVVEAANHEVPPASELPKLEAQSSPPTYEESNQPSHGGKGYRSDSNQFPPEFDGLLPAREDPTNGPASPEAATTSTTTAYGPEKTDIHGPAESMHFPVLPSRTNTNEIFHDASSRPLSSVTDSTTTNATHPPAEPAASAFDEFDEFAGLSEAKEADKAGDNDFAFDRHDAGEFNPAFESPAASMTNTMASAQQTPVPASRTIVHRPESSGFSTFQPSASTSSAFSSGTGSDSIQQTPQNAQHDWDAIFSGLDDSGKVDTSFGSSDPWGSTNGSGVATTSAAPAAVGAASSLSPSSSKPATSTTTTTTQPLASKAAQNFGRAITPGEEHDDPILKRLTSMGYPRTDALKALELNDYDINRAVDHLAGA